MPALRAADTHPHPVASRPPSPAHAGEGTILRASVLALRTCWRGVRARFGPGRIAARAFVESIRVLHRKAGDWAPPILLFWSCRDDALVLRQAHWGGVREERLGQVQAEDDRRGSCACDRRRIAAYPGGRAKFARRA